MGKAERLRAKWRKRAHVIEYRHVGEKCPGCHYVFTNGFSRIAVEGKHGFGGRDETLTICTRCRRPLAIPNAEALPIRLLTEPEIMLLSDNDRTVIRELAELFDVEAKGWD